MCYVCRPAYFEASDHCYLSQGSLQTVRAIEMAPKYDVNKIIMSVRHAMVIYTVRNRWKIEVLMGDVVCVCTLETGK